MNIFILIYYYHILTVNHFDYLIRNMKKWFCISGFTMWLLNSNELCYGTRFLKHDLAPQLGVWWSLDSETYLAHSLSFEL